MEAAPADEGEKDDKQKMHESFNRILADVLVEAKGEEKAAAAAEAIKRLKTRSTDVPKYFSGEVPRPEAVLEIDKVGAADGEGAAEPESQVKRLYGDMFHLCMALKPRRAEPATAEDANFDASIVDRFFSRVPAEAAEESLETLGGLVDGILEQGSGELSKSPAKLRAVLMMFAHTGLNDPGCFDVLKKLLKLLAQLHAEKDTRETLARWYAAMPLEVLERQVGMVQQFLTLTLLEAQGETNNSSSLEAVMEIARGGELPRHTRNALRLLDILWKANERRIAHRDDWRTRRKAQQMRQRGELMDDEAIKCLPLTQFHNDAINECEGILKHDLKEVLEMQYRGQEFPHAEDKRRSDFGVVEFPFVLTAVSKVRMLSIESLLMQREEVRHAMTLQMMLRNRTNMNPFLVLKVRRNAVIEDALQQLAIYGSQQFKKPLKVVFDGEEAVDEGGVQKEFFQLLIEELYNEDFGMFERIDESRNFWFNKNSFEVNLQFELFGIVLGLAIYNQVILDVKFPMAVYKKLMLGPKASLGLSDLLDFQPSLAQGLISLLEHPDSGNFEDVFGPLRFVVEYDCFGTMVEAELIEGGGEKPVTFENREDYVQRYCDWIFTKGVERQYGAFRKGFDQCIGDTLFRQLFRHDELELLICGSIELDFRALESATQYQDGFTASSDAVRWFWQVVHDLTAEEKRNLLQFCTGCDRAPVGGLGRLPFVVSRAGPDSDMLPWVHTCFNHLLLPAYKSKEKLEERLRLAIQHSTGFGLM